MTQVPDGMEREGSDLIWWVVCDKCHGMVCEDDLFCRHCGRPFRKRKSACDGCSYKGGEDCPLDYMSDRNFICPNGKLNMQSDMGEPLEENSKHVCSTCKNNADNVANGTKCPIQEHYVLPKNGFCHLWEGKENNGCKF